MKLFKRKPTEPVLVEREPGGRAELWREADGKLHCRCPYACMAACEPCAFRDRSTK